MISIEQDTSCSSFFVVSGKEQQQLEKLWDPTFKDLVFRKGTRKGSKVLRSGSNPYSLKTIVNELNRLGIDYKMDEQVSKIFGQEKKFPIERFVR